MRKTPYERATIPLKKALDALHDRKAWYKNVKGDSSKTRYERQVARNKLNELEDVDYVLQNLEDIE